jgi:hypothetical protein
MIDLEILIVLMVLTAAIPYQFNKYIYEHLFVLDVYWYKTNSGKEPILIQMMT